MANEFIERNKSGKLMLYRGKPGGDKTLLGKASQSDIERLGVKGEIGAVEAAKKAISGLFSGDDKKKGKSISEGLGSFVSSLTKNKGGYIGKSRTGHTDYRYNKGGMVMSSTNNMKKK
jgi:hypothetical protein